MDVACVSKYEDKDKMVWGNGGCEFSSLAASLMPSTRTEGKALLRRASSSIGRITIQASIGLPAFQNRTTDRDDG